MYRRRTGKRSLVLRTSREFHPTMDTPLKTQERITITFSCFGTPQIRNVLTAEIMMDEAVCVRERERELLTTHIHSQSLILQSLTHMHTKLLVF